MSSDFTGLHNFSLAILSSILPSFSQEDGLSWAFIFVFWNMHILDFLLLPGILWLPLGGEEASSELILLLLFPLSFFFFRSHTFLPCQIIYDPLSHLCFCLSFALKYIQFNCQAFCQSFAHHFGWLGFSL